MLRCMVVCRIRSSGTGCSLMPLRDPLISGTAKTKLDDAPAVNHELEFDIDLDYCHARCLFSHICRAW